MHIFCTNVQPINEYVQSFYKLPWTAMGAILTFHGGINKMTHKTILT